MTSASNPAPSAGAASPFPTKLFTPRQIGLATFFGLAIAGGLLMAVNCLRLQKKKEAGISFLVGLICTLAVFALAIHLPSFVVNGLYFGQAFAAGAIARQFLGDAIVDNVNSGGKRASNWAVFGSIVCGLLFVGTILVTLLFAAPDLISPSIQVGQEQKVYYDERASKEDATKFGAALKEVGYFQGDQPGIATIKKSFSGYTTLSFPVADGVWNNKEDVEVYTEMGRQLAPAVGGPPITVELTDSFGFSKRDIEIKK